MLLGYDANWLLSASYQSDSILLTLMSGVFSHSLEIVPTVRNAEYVLNY